MCGTGATWLSSRCNLHIYDSATGATRLSFRYNLHNYDSATGAMAPETRPARDSKLGTLVVLVRKADRLFGRVVKASVWRAADLGSIAVFYCGSFLRSSHTSDLQIDFLVQHCTCCHTETEVAHQTCYDNDNNRIQRRKSRFFTISSLRRELSPTRTLKGALAQSCANHVQLIKRISRVTCYVPRGTKRQLSFLVGQI